MAANFSHSEEKGASMNNFSQIKNWHLW
jgi:hypothetical protein